MTDALLRLVSTVSRLKDIDLFRRIPADYLVPLARIATETTFSEGEALFAEGEAGDGLYLVLEGEVTILHAGAQVARLGPGECLGEMAVLDAGSRSATAVGATAGRALKLPAADFQDILAGHPEISRALLTTLARRMRTSMDQDRAGISGAFPRVAARLATVAPADVPEAKPAGIQTGELLADRYVVGARLSRDVAAETFRGDDLEVGGPVRLTVLDASLVVGEGGERATEDRLGRARRFSHPQAARLLDILSEVHGTSVVVQEEPRGESLKERLERNGPLGAGEALQIVREVADVLAAAHAAGLVHGHLSSARIHLQGAGAGTRLAALLDLGCLPVRIPADRIAGDFGAEPHDPASTACLAPEQVRGEEARSTSDVYALGTLLHEMLSGRPPFLGTTAAETALSRLRGEPPELPLSDRWASALKRALSREPEDRFEGPAAFLTALGAAPDPRHPSRRRLAWLVAGAALAAGLGTLAGLRLATGRGSAPPSAPARRVFASRPSVAVLGFSDGSRVPVPWIPAALAEMLVSELAAGSRLRLIPGEEVARARAELKLPAAASLSRGTLGKIHGILQNDFVVLGSCTAASSGGTAGDAAGRTVRCEARLQDVRGGDIVTSVSGEVLESQLAELARRLGARLRYELRVGDVPLSLTDATEARVPSNPEARRLYAEGLERLRGFEALAARDLLARAVAADPRHALARSALAEAQFALGHDAEARESARQAWELSLDLPREDRLAVEARFHELSGARAQALALYERLVVFAPDSPEYSLRLATVETAAGRGKDALQVLATLRASVPSSARDPRTDLAEAEARQSLGDFPGQLAAAGRAETEARARGATLLLAPAKLLVSGALRRLGKRKEALAAAEEARHVFETAGDRAGAARALGAVAQLTGELGSLDEALRLHAAALAVFRELGNERGIAEARMGAGVALWQKGDLAGAQKTFRDALSLARQAGNQALVGRALNSLGNVAENAEGSRKAYQEALLVGRQTGDKGLQSTVLNNLAVLLEEAGDLKGARGSYEEAVAIKREIGDVASLPAPLTNIASIALRLGDLAGAETAGEESLAITRKGGSKRSLAFALTARGTRRLAAADLAAARQAFEEALEVRKGGDTGNVAGSRIDLSEIALQEGRLDDSARALTELAGSVAGSPHEIALHLLLARVRLAEGKTEEARREAETARGLAAKGDRLQDRVAADVLAARVLGASSKRAEIAAAREKLEALLPDAARLALSLSFEVRLALADLEARAGDAAAKRIRLEALEKEARGKGYLLAARLAARASGR